MRGFLARLRGRNSQQPSGVVTIVSGLPRSGTSLMMRMLEAGGIPVVHDEIRTADTDNPNGYYEFERVKKLPEGDVDWLPDAEGKVVKIISVLLKHLPPSHQYRIVFMERAMAEILASQQKMLDHRDEASDGVSDEEMMMLFGKHLRDVKGWLGQQQNMEVLFINYNDLLSDARAHVDKLNRLCGGALQTEPMLTMIDPDLYRNKVVF